jgi:UDP:flavonoid glycosyltransferase YjiC (YdhE family)
MSNILVTTLGSYGDVYPMVGLGAELRRRGHSVTLLTNPFFEALAGKHGLRFIPIGTQAQYERFAGHPDLFHPRIGARVFFSTLVVPGIRDAYPRLIERVEPARTVILSSISVLAARLAQEKESIPNVTAHIAPMMFKSAHEMPRIGFIPFPGWLPLGLRRLYWLVADRAVVDPMLCPELNAVRAELGLPPVRRVMTRWGHSPQRVIGLFPAWFAAPQPDWPAATRLTGFPLFDEDQDQALDTDVEAFLDAGEPPVIFMPGSLMRHAEAFFRAAVQACQALGLRAMLLSRHARHIPDPLPPGMKHFTYVPLARVLPRACALAHHGGIGTTAQALKAGVPQLAHPMAYDQHDNAWRLKQLGVGDAISPSKWRASVVADALRVLTTSPRVRACCREVAGRFESARPAAEACDLVEAML